jgi:predicted RNase H-like nuclease (RuvC/YqgF family)
MSQTSETIQRKLLEINSEKHRLAQQKYYWNKKGESITNALELKKLRNHVSFLSGQLEEKERTQNRTEQQLQTQISQLQQQLNERNTTIIQLQSLLSRSEAGDGNQEERGRVQEITQALTNEIQRGQHCLEIINQLRVEKDQLLVFRNLLVELNDKYPKILSSFVYEISQPGNQASLAEINTWAAQEIKNVRPETVISLGQFR